MTKTGVKVQKQSKFTALKKNCFRIINKGMKMIDYDTLWQPGSAFA